MVALTSTWIADAVEGKRAPRAKRSTAVLPASPGRAGTQSARSAVVGFLREYTGRSPTKARTTIRANVVLVMLEHTLTKGEQVYTGSYCMHRPDRAGPPEGDWYPA